MRKIYHLLSNIYQFKKNKNDRSYLLDHRLSAGFTLIELLAAMTVFITIGSIIAATLVSTLRGNNKANSLISVRENGNYALIQMEKLIKEAKGFNGVRVNGASNFATCEPPAVGALTPTPAPANLHYKEVQIRAFDDNLVTIQCTATNIASISSAITGTQPLLIDVASGITLDQSDPNNCYFTCSQNTASDYPAIGISFSLTKQNQSAVSLFENTASVTFQSTVDLRNLRR